jgi:hypothetical protein
VTAPIAEHVVLVTTDVPQLDAAQRRDLVERMNHWLPDVLTSGPLAVRMTLRTSGGPVEAARKAGSVLRHLLRDTGIGGRVVDVQPAGDAPH